MSVGLWLTKNVTTPLAKSLLVPLGSTAGASTTDAGFQKKKFGSGTTALIFSNDEMNVIMKTTKSFKESDLLTKDVNVTIKNEAGEQNGGIQGETFWYFTKFSFNHKWNNTRLLLMNMVHTSCLTSCGTT